MLGRAVNNTAGIERRLCTKSREVYAPLHRKGEFVASGHVLHDDVLGLHACGSEGLFGAGNEGVYNFGIPPGVHDGNAQAGAFGRGMGSATGAGRLGGGGGYSLPSCV